MDRQRTRCVLCRDRQRRAEACIRLLRRRTWAQISGQAAQQRRSSPDRCEPRKAARATNGATSLALRRLESHEGREVLSLPLPPTAIQGTCLQTAECACCREGGGCPNAERKSQRLAGPSIK